jgi:hypothetical protein
MQPMQHAGVMPCPSCNVSNPDNSPRLRAGYHRDERFDGTLIYNERRAQCAQSAPPGVPSGFFPFGAVPDAVPNDFGRLCAVCSLGEVFDLIWLPGPDSNQRPTG